MGKLGECGMAIEDSGGGFCREWNCSSVSGFWESAAVCTVMHQDTLETNLASPSLQCGFTASWTARILYPVRLSYGGPNGDLFDQKQSWGWRGDLSAMSTCCSCRGTGFDPHHPLHNSQISVTPAPWALTPFSGISGPCSHLCKHKHIHKNLFLKKRAVIDINTHMHTGTYICISFLSVFHNKVTLHLHCHLRRGMRFLGWYWKSGSWVDDGLPSTGIMRSLRSSRLRHICYFCAACPVGTETMNQARVYPRLHPTSLASTRE